MALTDTEVELTFPLLNREELLGVLKRIATPVKVDQYQKDTYFIPPHRNFLKQTLAVYRDVLQGLKKTN